MCQDFVEVRITLIPVWKIPTWVETTGRVKSWELQNWLAVQFCSATQSCPTVCNPMDCSTPRFPLHHQLLELTQTHVHQGGDAIQPPHSLLLPSPTFNLSQHQVFSNESVLPIRRPKYWSFSFSISPSNEYSELISFRMDWLDILAIQGTLKSLLQHHNPKASILQCSAFFIVQLSHPYKELNQGLLHCRQVLYQLSYGLHLTITPVLCLFWNVVLLISKFLPQI